MSVVRDVKVKLRLNILTVEMLERGSDKAGKEGSTRKIIADMPEITIDADELERRLSDAAVVLSEGWELDNDGPSVVQTNGITLLTKNSATLHAHVVASSQTPCGFYWGTTKDVTSSTHAATQSPVNALATADISWPISGLTPGTKYYYRPYVAVAGQIVKYGNVRSFTTPLV